MRASLVLGAGKGPRLAVLESLRRFPGGLGVRELSAELGMSYMGVKAHCLALERSGHLISRRGPSSKGRPSLLYSLSESGRGLFEGSGQDLALGLLREASGLFGAAAPQKLLMMYFRSEAARYASLIRSEDPMQRVVEFVRIRDAEGRICSFVEGSRPEVHECHDPLSDLRKPYPGIDAMEEAMVAEVLRMRLHRRQEVEKVVFSLVP